MPKLIQAATRVQGAGNMPKLIDEYVGRLNTGHEAISVAHMRSPAGWQEPGQTPEFDEYTIVLQGVLHVVHKGGTMEVKAGQAIVAHAGEWIQYSTQADTEYIAICMPAFSPQTAHRDQ
jgi:ethanolamine utilization protein EutQ (cupin superfamily)